MEVPDSLEGEGAQVRRTLHSAQSASTVFVRGFELGTAEERICKHCSTAGEVLRCKFATKKKSAVLVTYSSPEVAEMAIQTLNKTVIDGNERYITLKMDEGSMAGKGPKPAKPGGPDLPRERVTANRVNGIVLDWRPSGFGWILPKEEVNHPEARRHGKKIYIHQKDLPSGVAMLAKDTEVYFHIYVDADGIGAEDVLLDGIPD